MEEVQQPTGDKSAPQRAAQACQRCRSLKTRCYLSNQPGTCQRCLKSKRDCVWADAPRKARKQRGPSRISQVEQKIDGLVASLTNAEPPNSVAAVPDAPSSDKPHKPYMTRDRRPLAPGSWLPFPSSFAQEPSPEKTPPDLDTGDESMHRDAEANQQFLERLRAIHNFGDDNTMRPPSTLVQSANRHEPSIEDTMVQQLLSTGEANSLLREYNAMSASFPFVPLYPLPSADELHTAKPMLFLAILVVASWKNHKLQLQLDEVYRKELANRTIVRPRRTLPLLQSIIMYLSWYHFVFSHRTQQIFFLQQLANGLAIDLGLHQKTKRALIDMPGLPKPPPLQPGEQMERQRTFLGCYYLSSMISGGLQKPNFLKHTDYMDECCQDLKLTREYAGDSVIANLISLRRIDDQIYDTFHSSEGLDLSVTDPRVVMNLRFIATQLSEWKKSGYSEAFQRTLDLSSAFTELQLHSIAFRTSNTPETPSGVNQTRLNSLLSTLEAAKRFFDALLSFPVSDYHLISFSEWMRLPFVVMTTARLCMPSDAHSAAQWDVKAAQDRVRLDLYLESLCYRMQSLSTHDKAKKTHPDFWWAMRMIMDLTRTWYCRKLNPPPQPTPANIATPETTSSSDQRSAGTFTSTGADSIDCINGFPPQMLGAAHAGTAYDMPTESFDPFEFMQSADFDMDQILDIGIWGSESYEGMGFGGGNMGF